MKSFDASSWQYWPSREWISAILEANSWLNVAVDRTSDNATLPKWHQACLTANARKNSGDNSTPRPGLSGTSQDDRLTFQPSTKISLYCAVLVFPSSMITKFGMEAATCMLAAVQMGPFGLCGATVT